MIGHSFGRMVFVHSLHAFLPAVAAAGPVAVTTATAAVFDFVCVPGLQAAQPVPREVRAVRVYGKRQARARARRGCAHQGGPVRTFVVVQPNRS